uniref:Uncharacterized protein n=1 Tax=Ditylenchus dipsaci TaxID=166011 RepID=A0A915DAS7_9BILA
MIMNLDNYFRIIYDNGMTNIFNQLTFGWFSSLADIAKERAIKTSDMKAVSEDYSSLFLVKQWDRQLILLASLEDKNLLTGIAYTLLLFICVEVRSVAVKWYFIHSLGLGLKLQALFTSLIYNKIVLSSDIDTVQQFSTTIHNIWSCPLQISLSLAALYYLLGCAVIPGVLITILFVPLAMFGSKFTKLWQKQQMGCEDKRVRMSTEVFSNIKSVKLFAWEPIFLSKVEQLRSKELGCVRKAALVQSLIDTLNYWAPFLVAFSSFGAYTCLRTVQSTALSNDSHRQSHSTAEHFNVSFDRLNKLIHQDSGIDSPMNLQVNCKLDECEISSVDLKCATFAWKCEDMSPVLSEINLCLPANQLTTVIGPIGSGKSALLQAILGELHLVSGTAVLPSGTPIGYVSQSAFIRNSTLRNNILFGKPYDELLYKEVIQACALVHDIAKFDNGDQIQIGDKGATLSGGQKARVSLARAIYQQYTIYLLDDPLSGLDAAVAAHVFKEVIGAGGMLKNTTRILTCHVPSFIPQSDYVLVMQGGTITSFDPVTNLSSETFMSLDTIQPQQDIDQPIAPVETRLTENEKLVTANTPTTSQQLIGHEKIETGMVKLDVLLNFMQAAKYVFPLLFLLLLTAFQGLQVGGNYWLSKWTNKNEHNNNHTLTNDYIIVYGYLGLLQGLSFLFGLLVLIVTQSKVSSNLHNRLFERLLRAKMSFFATTPLGNIISRLTKDIETIDVRLCAKVRSFTIYSLQIAASLLVIGINTPIFFVLVLPLAVCYVRLLKNYLPLSRQLKRLDGGCRSPVLSHFSETINGVSTIRAFQLNRQFGQIMEQLVDRSSQAKYMNLVAGRWLGLRLELLGAIVVLVTGVFAALSNTQYQLIASASLVGLSLSYALNLTELLNGAVREVNELELHIISVERVSQYLHIPIEDSWECIGDAQLGVEWPQTGDIQFKQYTAAYEDDLKPCLNQINLDIRSGEKVAVVGRTGAGKSSLVMSLLRMLDSQSGSISMNNADISNIGLHKLRRSVTIIPQDPLLISGPLRFNLDPFNANTDALIWKALEDAHIKSLVQSLEGGLQANVRENGSNMSLGERQLICLARAILHPSKIVIMDEANASLDTHTDELVQTTIRQVFRQSTIISIVHRQEAINTSDRLIQLENGSIINDTHRGLAHIDS